MRVHDERPFHIVATYACEGAAPAMTDDRTESCSSSDWASSSTSESSSRTHSLPGSMASPPTSPGYSFYKQTASPVISVGRHNPGQPGEEEVEENKPIDEP